MFDFFSQLRLKRQGFSSGKKRRKQREYQILEFLRHGKLVRLGLFVAFAAVISLLVIYAGHPISIFAGQPGTITVAVFVIVATLMIQLHVNLPDSFRMNARVLLLLAAIIGQLLLIKFSEYVAMTFAPDGNYAFLVAPYAFAPMLMSLLIGRNHGTFAAVYAGMLGGLMVEASLAFPFLIFSLICGFVAVYLTHKVRRRSRLVTAGIYVGFTCVIVGITLGKIPIPSFENGYGSAEVWEILGRKALSAVGVATVTAILVGGLLPVIEALFRITTDISWIELADLNHPLLKKMTMEAPGTYHHSLVVAGISEAAAEQIGANATQCRVCSYFHDIGKLKKPEYFIENIGEGQNPHDDLTPTMSALIIIAHVKDGVDMALKNKLNREIIAVIREHHGTSLIQYFYHRACEQKKDLEQEVVDGNGREEDIPEVNQEGFRYPGPKPQTRESAIVSLADAVESASRSLQKPTPLKIKQLIEEITRSRLKEGQFDDCTLTLKDLAIIKESFFSSLRSMMHNRISYPKLDEDDKGDGATRPIKPKKKVRSTVRSDAQLHAAKPKAEASGHQEQESGDGKPKSTPAGAA